MRKNLSPSDRGYFTTDGDKCQVIFSLLRGPSPPWGTEGGKSPRGDTAKRTKCAPLNRTPHGGAKSALSLVFLRLRHGAQSEPSGTLNKAGFSQPRSAQTDGASTTLQKSIYCFFAFRFSSWGNPSRPMRKTKYHYNAPEKGTTLVTTKRNKKQGRDISRSVLPLFFNFFLWYMSPRAGAVRSAGAQAKQSNQKRRPPTRLATPDSTEHLFISFLKLFIKKA